MEIDGDGEAERGGNGQPAGVVELLCVRVLCEIGEEEERERPFIVWGASVPVVANNRDECPHLSRLLAITGMNAPTHSSRL